MPACASLLGGQLRERVAGDTRDREWIVAVGMHDRANDRRLDKNLVAREVELELGKRRLWVQTAVGESPLRGRHASQVPALDKRAVIYEQLDSRLLLKPGRDPTEDLRQFLWSLGCVLDDWSNSCFEITRSPRERPARSLGYPIPVRERRPVDRPDRGGPARPIGGSCTRRSARARGVREPRRDSPCA